MVLLHAQPRSGPPAAPCKLSHAVPWSRCRGVGPYSFFEFDLRPHVVEALCELNPATMPRCTHLSQLGAPGGDAVLARLTQLDNTWPGRDEAALDANISNLFDVQRMHRRSLQRSPIRQPPPLPRPPPRRPGGHPPFPAPCPSPSAWSFAAPQHGGASGGGDGGGRRSAGWSTVFPHLIDNGVYDWTDPRCPYLSPLRTRCTTSCAARTATSARMRAWSAPTATGRGTARRTTPSSASAPTGGVPPHHRAATPGEENTWGLLR